MCCKFVCCVMSLACVVCGVRWFCAFLSSSERVNCGVVLVNCFNDLSDAIVFTVGWLCFNCGLYFYFNFLSLIMSF